jgi:two-component system sensor histidine kinase KdpD
VIEPDPASAALIRRGRRVADYLHADCLGVYVGEAADLRHLDDEERDRLQRHLSFAQALQIETRVLEGPDLAETLVTFARQQRVTQIFILRQKDRTLRSWLTEGLVQQIVNRAQDMQVTVVADRSIRKRSA